MTDPLAVLRYTVQAHQSLDVVAIRSVVGGALALAYHVQEPRATRDIDLNILLPREQARFAFESLPPGPQWDDSDVSAVQRDGQVRLPWPVDDAPPIPLDLFFAEHRFHRVAADRAVDVPMLDAQIPILTATDLVVFKALFDRAKDWVDIQEIVNFSPPSYEQDEVVRWLSQIVGADDPRTRRAQELAPETDRPFRWPG